MNEEQRIKKVMIAIIIDDMTGKMVGQYSSVAMFSIHCE